MIFQHIFESSNLVKGKCECSESPHFYSIISTIHHSDEVRKSSKNVIKTTSDPEAIADTLLESILSPFCIHFVTPEPPQRRSRRVRSASSALPDALRDAFWSSLGGSWGVLERPWAVLERSAPFAGSVQGLCRTPFSSDF